MSLEEALNRNTETMERLIATLQSGALPGGQPADTTKATGRGKKETPAPTQAPTPPAAQVDRTKLQPGDPAGTIYLHIAKHRTVAAIKPGDVMPTVDGAVEVNGDEYAKLKAEYTVVPPAAAGAQTGSPAANPASGGPGASTASSQTQGASPAMDGPAITEKCKTLHLKQGNEGVKKVLAKFGVTNVPGLLTKTADYLAIADYIDELLNPGAATPPGEVNLF